MWNKINRFYPAWLELIPVLWLGWVLFYTATNYSVLPEQIPTHFGITGEPDAWSAKGVGTVYLPAIIGMAVWLLMFICNYFAIIKPDDPGKCINISQREKEKLGPEKMEAIRTTMARGLMVLNLTVVALIITMQYGSINTAMGLQKGLGWGVGIFSIALIVEALGLTIKTLGMTWTSQKSH